MLNKKGTASSFAEAVRMIKDNVCKQGSYVPYVRFTILDTEVEGNDIDSVSFSTNNHTGLENNICCIVNFENNKNGSGLANSFSITIAYYPSRKGLFYSESAYSEKLDFSNINLIDEILVKSKNHKCKIQYGYTYPMTILTPEYEGRIIDYSTEINNGVLYYTITGYSGLAIEYRDLKFSMQGSIDGQDPVEKKPTQLIQEIYDEYLKDKTDYILEWGEDTKDTDKEIEVSTQQDVSVLEYMQSLVNVATYSQDSDDVSATDPDVVKTRSSYHMIISDVPDADGKKTILIARYDPIKSKAENDESNTIRFAWMGSNPNLDNVQDYAADAMVINFKANYKGSVGMAYDYTKLKRGLDILGRDFKKSGINESGEIVQAYGTKTPLSGADTKNLSSYSLNLWANRLQYCYTATLVTLGIPYEVMILDNVYIAPMIYGQQHHTGGLYLVTKITDIIDGSGFTTTLELAKNTSNEELAQKKIQAYEELGEAAERYDKYSNNPIHRQRVTQDLENAEKAITDLYNNGEGVD